MNRLFLVLGWVCGAAAIHAASAPVQVDTSPRHNRRWMTVYTNEVPLAWEWPAGAVSAALSAGGASAVFGTGTSNWVWQAFTGAAPGREAVVDVTLTFSDGVGAVVGALTSRLAVVAGAFGGMPVDPGPSDRAWMRFKGGEVVGYDAGWLPETSPAAAGQLTVGKAGTVDIRPLPDASGYTVLDVKSSEWGYGTFSLTLDFPGTAGDWEVLLNRNPSGTQLQIR